MLKKSKGRYIGGYGFFKICFYHYFLQRAYGTLKQNLVKFKNTQVIN